MIYRDFKGEKLSAYGMGTMRLPVIGGDDNRIDEPAATEMIDYALEHGVNYFDTAWGYHGGTSETVVGAALARHPRESFNLVTKFPGYDLDNMGKVEEIFERQLEKCQTDYFDFYLIHNVCELNVDAYLDDEQYRTVSYLKAQRDAGRIRHLGFSTHGSNDTMRLFLERYGEDMEFVQIQLNYLDWEFQDAKGKVELARQWKLPIISMEPVRGGQLARLSDDHAARLEALRPGFGQAAWAMRYLQTIPDVVVTLSGASTLDQMKENIAAFDAPDLTEAEVEVLRGIAADMVATDVLPCTACHYCTSHCPLELDIPWLLSLYQEHKFTKGGFIAPMALASIPEEKHPSACIGCGSCAAVCPQQIDIPAKLADFAELLK